MKKILKICLVSLCFMLVNVVYAKEYVGEEVYSGMNGVIPNDKITFPENAREIEFSPIFGVRVKFIDEDGTELMSEVVKVTENGSDSMNVPDAPKKGSAEFKGWERNDKNSGKATLNKDGTVTDIDGPGPIVFIATYEKDQYKVIYEIAGSEEWGMPKSGPTLEDNNLYDYLDKVEVKSITEPIEGYAVNSKTGKEVKGVWRFILDEEVDQFEITEDTVLRGHWEFTPAVSSPLTEDKILMVISISIISAVILVLTIYFKKKSKIA